MVCTQCYHSRAMSFYYTKYFMHTPFNLRVKPYMYYIVKIIHHEYITMKPHVTSFHQTSYPPKSSFYKFPQDLKRHSS